jgi:hypothetical protein
MFFVTNRRYQLIFEAGLEREIWVYILKQGTFHDRQQEVQAHISATPYNNQAMF